MRKGKIILIAALLTAAALICTLAFAAQSGSCGDGIIWTLDDEGHMTISGSGPMTEVPGTGNWSFNYLVTSVSFDSGLPATATDLPATTTDLPPAGVTSVISMAFYDCDSLTEVILPESMQSIDFWAFANCDSLALAVIPDSVTVIDDLAFDACPNLTIRCRKGSAAYAYAAAHGIPVDLVVENIVTLPEDITEIGIQAFANDPAIDAIRFPAHAVNVAEGAIGPDVVIIAPAGSPAAQWAAANGYALIEE